MPSPRVETLLLTPVYTARITGFPKRYFAELGHYRLQTLPNPPGNGFTGRILQTIDIIQIIVIKLKADRLKRFFDLGKIHDPSGFWVFRAGNRYTNLERMTMKTAALMVRRQVRQQMSRFKSELFKDFHDNDNSMRFTAVLNTCAFAHSTANLDEPDNTREHASYSMGDYHNPSAAIKNDQIADARTAQAQRIFAGKQI